MSEKENLIDDKMKKQLDNLSKEELIELFVKERDNRKRLVKQLYNLKTIAYYDVLTSDACKKPIYNRVYWETYKKRNCASTCEVCMIDIDDLSITNNTLGHAMGDKLICDSIKLICNYGRVFRFGGDEFVLIPDNDKIDAFKQMLHDKMGTLNFSYGIYEKQPYETFEEALNKADKIMYNMKFQKKVGRDYHRQR